MYGGGPMGSLAEIFRVFDRQLRKSVRGGLPCKNRDFCEVEQRELEKNTTRGFPFRGMKAWSTVDLDSKLAGWRQSRLPLEVQRHDRDRTEFAAMRL